MTDELDDIKKLLKNAPSVEPDERAKNDAISKAMLAFDEKHSTSRQGIRFQDRLMDAVHAAFETISGERFMKKGYVWAGGLSLAALTVALLNSSHFNDIMPKQPPIETQVLEKREKNDFSPTPAPQ